jgi:prepilin-type N-terminal cleavage/methylation domain-containing protein
MINIGPRARSARQRRGAFSFVELLTVLAVIGVLTTLAMSGFASALSANHINEATSVVQGQLELARQTAKTLNRSLQIVVPAEDATTEIDQAIEKPVQLPQKVIFADASSDLQLTASPSTGPTGHLFNPSLSSSYSGCYILTFSSTGAITAMDASGNSLYPSSSTVYWTLSLVPQTQYRVVGSIAQMKNYATFYLNSVNGTYSCTRP